MENNEGRTFNKKHIFLATLHLASLCKVFFWHYAPCGGWMHSFGPEKNIFIDFSPIENTV